MLQGNGSRRKPRHENANYWMSYSDMMAALLLMFVLLLFLSFNRYTTLQAERDADNVEKQAMLTAQEAALLEKQVAIENKDLELITLQAELAGRVAALESTNAALLLKEEELTSKEGELTLAQAQLILQQQDIEEKERLLTLSTEEVEEAQRQLDLYSQDLSDREILLSEKDTQLLLEKLRVTDLETLLAGQAAQIDELVGVRARIIEQLRDGLMREGLNVTVDTSGAITMDSTIFFDTGKYSIKDDGRAVLMQLLPIYYRTLMSAENAGFVSDIIIEGHTDSVGSYESNLDLSQRRAQAVVNFCLSDEFVGLTAEEKATLRKMITANGRSESQLIYGPDGVEDKAASRRVEFKFRLKDAEMVENMARLLSAIGE